MKRFLLVLLMLALPMVAADIEWGKQITSGPLTIQLIGISAAGLATIPTAHPGLNMVQVFLRTTSPETAAFRVTLKTATGVQRAVVEPFAVPQYWQAVAIFWTAGKPTAPPTVEELTSAGPIEF